MPELEKLAFPGHKGVQVLKREVRECTIESVVVYKDRAEVKRAVPLTLAAGENEVVVCGLAECVDKESIRVEGEGKAVITDVIYSSKTTSEVKQSSPGSKEEYEAMKDEENKCRVELQHSEFKEQVLKSEKDLLSQFANHISTIHSIKGGDNSLSQLVDNDNVIAVLEFFEKYEAKIADLDARLSTVTQDIVTMKEKIAVLQANADKINPNKKVTSTETLRAIHVGLDAPAETEAVLYLSYVVSNASWNSAYDVRVFTKDQAMKVQYYGLIKQQTGEDWENAKVSLSTAQPSIGGSAPHLPTKIVRFKRPVRMRPVSHDRLETLTEQAQMFQKGSAKSGGLRFGRRVIERSIQRESSELDEDMDEINCLMSMNSCGGGGASILSIASAPPPPPALDITVAKVNAGLFNATYAIPRATTIPADNTEHKVTVALVDLSPDFHYNSVPRLSPHSFLQAKTKNTSPYTMLAGPANIFLDNNFVAKSELSDVSPNEEFTISLGVDQSLRITCQPVGAVRNTRSKSTTITYTHQFFIKNTKSHSANIHLSEQVPLSTDDRIKVHVVQPEVRKAGVQCAISCGYAILNESNNIEWHVSVDSGAELELRLVYTIQHPAQDYVQGLPK